MPKYPRPAIEYAAALLALQDEAEQDCRCNVSIVYDAEHAIVAGRGVGRRNTETVSQVGVGGRHDLAALLQE